MDSEKNETLGIGWIVGVCVVGEYLEGGQSAAGEIQSG